MPSVQQTILVNAAPERAWAWLTAPRFYPLWMDGVAAVRAVSSMEIGPGTTFTVVRDKRPTDEAWIVAEWAAPRRLRLAAYRTDRQMVFEVAAAPGGAQLTVAQTWPPSRGMLSRLMPPHAQQRALDRTLTRLRAMFALNQDIRLLHGMGDE